MGINTHDDYDAPLRCGRCGRHPTPALRVGRCPRLGIVICQPCAEILRRHGTIRPLSRAQVSAWLQPGTGDGTES